MCYMENGKEGKGLIYIYIIYIYNIYNIFIII